MHPNLDEIQLLEELMKGSETAFKKIYLNYHGSLYRMALKFVKSEELAKEIVQDVFVKIWENRSQINTSLSFSAFLFRIAHNHIFNLLKRASKEAAIKNEILAAAETASNYTENEVLSAEYETLAIDAIEQLPPQRKLIFKLCRNEGKSYEEVSYTLGISKSTVRDHMVKAIKFIKDYLQAHTQTTFLVCLMAWFL
ncbi:RNA polymerase sigma-70 factor [Rhodocytophaga aerolata]|uniref:RNA polymerase sigma-70 factor n=1 Tax=Rhodocytophaga aerolata TaxID=455078 RepID=A0ABT8QY79_9BACT|nr:RNA polymerase sigma-70 factor [Rhodocytophaga aerolata]MDO1444795.1 RNA polymerase sigma-70 factor [Rhodocytophaga aerolata]